MMTLGTWALTTVVGGLVGWAVWTLWRDRQSPQVSGRWLDDQALRETKRGWDGPRWWLPRERRERRDRQRVMRIAETRREMHIARRKDGTTS